MPGGAITDQEDFVISVLLGQFTKKSVHAYCVALRCDQKTIVPGARVNSTEYITIFSDMMTGNRWPVSISPAVFGGIDPSETGFVLKHDPNWFVHTN